ncbi:3-deoxy-D-manno-octulosonate 8-phosphate phosphatas KdsC [Moraxella caprae]|uniref:3-deoxy-D-manno-octulosonate 8-phosphate phosphatase KdsC n=1 Tax=Moraxella caprae TaxID=90240 RepID=A0A378R1B5_9GAMM|nr:HAD hydrolase family protein [Moraxella caprae]STZ08995.1 3-deoxy-D-manno-octulosonate 8-phosphate phosphatas KdsC [Moraxella caprae]
MSDLTKRLQAVKLFAMDVDGILSDGQIIYDANGIETKAFYVQDGVGLKALKEQGIILAIITGRNSPMVARRADELGIDHVVQGRDDKFTALSALADELGLSVGECMYMGDDLPDLKAVREAGVGVSVPNGCAETQAVADIVTTKSGGHGAVREVCEQLLKAKGAYDAFIAQYI